jgi:hypothetical protein
MGNNYPHYPICRRTMSAAFVYSNPSNQDEMLTDIHGTTVGVKEVGAVLYRCRRKLKMSVMSITSKLLVDVCVNGLV